MRILLMRAGAAALAGLLVLGGIAGCATPSTYRSGNRSTAAEALPGKPGCLFLGNYEGDWQVLNDASLIVYALPSDSQAYLMRLAMPVVGLKFNERLGFLDVQHTGRICGNLNAWLVVPGNTPNRILITAVQQLSYPERRQLLAQAGIASPRHEARNAVPGRAPH
jgi:hypothetical protein